MNILLYIGGTALLGVACWGIGSFIGNWFGKKKQMQDEVRRNGSRHI